MLDLWKIPEPDLRSEECEAPPCAHQPRPIASLNLSDVAVRMTKILLHLLDLACLSASQRSVFILVQHPDFPNTPAFTQTIRDLFKREAPRVHMHLGAACG